ncbi:MAG TPA: 4'-phosphopantetheinyl transferase superfamily protein [Rhodothermales bacterium]
MMTGSETTPSFPGLASDIAWAWQEYDADRWRELMSWLSPSERVSLDSYRSDKRKTEFVLGRAAARLLIGGRLGVPPSAVNLNVADDGAVEVAGAEIHLSISHANGWATAVISPRPVGIDMERLAPRSPRVYRYFLSKDEYDLLEATDLDHDRLQVLLWALKESVLKGTRTGLRVSPRDIRVTSLHPDGTASIRDRDGASWRLEWIFWRGCYLAIADRENLQ